MTSRRLARWGWIYCGALAVVCFAVYCRFSLRRSQTGEGVLVVSESVRGLRVARHLVAGRCSVTRTTDLEITGAIRVTEEIVDAGPILGRGRIAFGISFAPAVDGVRAEYLGRTAVLTPDDLQQLHAYDARLQIGKWVYSLGVDREIAVGALARELGAAESDLIASGRFSRVATRKCAVLPDANPEIGAENLDIAVVAAGRYLSGQLKLDGSFHYELDPFTNQLAEGYSWPRHAGATFFLAQAARHSGLAELARAARHAAARMSDATMLHCGVRRCVGDGAEVNIGSSALALLAFVELVESGLGAEFRNIVFELADFLRSQQRADGEFMHRYDIAKGRAIDVQQVYFTGEAALALARAERITRDPRDLDASKRAVAYLTYRPWWALAMRHFWGAEHWTCQAMEDLWDRAPNEEALEFCLTWQDYVRADMIAEGEFAGAIAGQPYNAIRYTPTASRMEAAIATLSAARKAGVASGRVSGLESGIRRSLQLLMRTQFLPGPAHLMPSPHNFYGGFPGGSVDYHVRIDYPQHAAAALLRYRLLKFSTGFNGKRGQ